MTAGVTQLKTEILVYGGIFNKIESNLQDSVITWQSPDVGRPKEIGVWSAGRLARVSWEKWASSNQACRKEQDSVFLQAHVCLQGGSLASEVQQWLTRLILEHAIGEVQVPQQCLTLGQLHFWRASAYALTSTELHTSPLLLPCSRTKFWDQPSASFHSFCQSSIES